ncbi:hypothetical protein RND81_03G158500 [Saponaria officinalis]|uniref:F-box protein n=1 Tax=Saponaria officinalis TaxID=3572 RepID=A0AAW1M7F5_SAPOF
MAADWSSLPFDLVCTIALKLETFEDFIYFSVVCRSWNHASSLIKHQWRASPAVPWLLLAENTNKEPKSARKFFNLENNKCYKFNLPEMVEARCWGSVHGWLVMVDYDLNVQLFNPITKARIYFPSAKLFFPYPNNKEHFDDYEDYIEWFLCFFLVKFIVVKISSGEFVIMVLYDWPKHLAFARHGDHSWTKVVSRNGPDAGIGITDVTSVNENVFALYNDGAVLHWNVKEFGGCGFVKPVNYCPSQFEIFEELEKGLHKIYLVKSDKQLLMILRKKEDVLNVELTDYGYDFVHRTIDFQVYRFNSQDRKWEEIQDFGDVALIVGNNSSMSVSVASSKSMQQSCIYFTDDEYDTLLLIEREEWA